MARSAPVALDSAAKYQSLFNNTNGLWSGAEKLIPVTLPSGAILWISGLCWSGNASAGGGSTRATGSIHNIYSSFIIQGDSTLRIINPYINDVTNSRFFSLDSFTANGQKFSRLDPISAVVHDENLYISCKLSSTDFSNWTLALGPMYLLTVNISMIDKSNTIIINNITALPYLTLSGGNSIYFGSCVLDFSDNYLYTIGQQNIPSTNIYNYYISRIPWIFLHDSTKWVYFNTSKWVSALTVGGYSTIVSTQTPEISLWKENNKYYILSRQLYTSNNINLYESSYLFKNYQLLSTVATMTSRPSGAWSNGAYFVPHAILASGNKLGFYSNGIANDTYDISNPLFKRPTFFEF